jgi:hypothetical protein
LQSKRGKEKVSEVQYHPGNASRKAGEMKKRHLAMPEKS